MIRILIADDEHLIRQTLKAYLKVESDFEIVETAENGQIALTLIEKLNPDIVLMDLEMPEIDGLTATKIINQRFSKTKVLILSSHNNQDYIDRAFKAGAQGYVLKSTPGGELSQVIRLIDKGDLKIAPKISVDVNSLIGEQKALPETTKFSSKAVLSETKTRGWGNKQKIASEKTISSSTNYHSSPSSLIQNLQLNQYQPDLSSLPIASPDEFLPSIAHWLNRGAVVLSIVFGATLFLASILKYKVTVRADAQIRPTGELSLVQAAVEGKVERIEVVENQNVEVGDTIAAISNSQLQTQKQQLEVSIQQTQQQIIQVDTQIDELKRQIVAEQKSIDRIIASAKADLNLSQREYKDRQALTQAEIREAEATAKLAREEWERYQQLASTGIVSRAQISEKKAALEAALARLERSQVSLNPSSANVTKAKERIAQAKARGEATIANLDREKESLQEKKITLQQQLKRARQELQQIDNNLKDTNIVAPIAGTIQKIHLRNQEQLVSRGDLIAQITPSRVPLLIKASVPSQDIAKVEIGQAVQLRIFACPYTDFGTLQGNITAISPDTFQLIREENITSSKDSNHISGTYTAMIEPVSVSLIKDGQECQLKSGMKARADIITREETVLTFVLRKARLINPLT